MRILPFPKCGAVLPEDSLPSTAEAVNFTMDAFGRVTSVDSVWIAVVGLTLAQFASGEWVDRIHPDDAGPVMRRFFKALAECRPFSVSTRFKVATGNYVDVRLRIVPFLDPHGRVLHWRGVLTYDAAQIDNADLAGSNIS